MTSKVRSSKRNLEMTESKGKGKKGAMKPRDVHPVGIEIDRDEEEEVNGKTTNLSEEDHYKVHRWRFSDWTPSAVQSLAADIYSPNLAVGREDGEIEICDTKNKFLVKSRIAGSVDFKLQQLCWSNMTHSRGRLFGISLRGFVFEVNLKELTHGNFLDTYGGTPWCMAASPRDTTLVIGCEDGCRLFDYSDIDLQYKRSVASAGVRVLSVAYHPVLPQLYLGCADGTIRCIHEDTGAALLRLTGDVSRGLNTYIFCITVLSDSTVVSGDNRGHLQVWDGNTGVLAFSFKQHAADIRCVCSNNDEDMIFASGTDSRVVCIRRVRSHQNSESMATSLIGSATTQSLPLPSSSKWVYSTAHRPHSHDVLALTIVQSHEGSTLVSGGLDAKICSYSVENFDKSRPSWILPVPAVGLVGSSLSTNLMTVAHRNYVDLWQLRPSLDASVEDHDDSIHPRKRTKKSRKHVVTKEDQPAQLLGRLFIKGSAHIKHAILSPNGKFLVVISTSGTRIWSIDASNDNKGLSIFNRLDYHEGDNNYFQSLSCHSFVFSHNSELFAAASSDGRIVLGTFQEDESNDDNDGDDEDDRHANAQTLKTRLKFIHEFDHRSTVEDNLTSSERSLGGAASLEYVVKTISFSPDGQWLCICSAGRRVYVYELDRLRTEWALPIFSCPVTRAMFTPHNALLVILADNSFVLFDVLQHQMKIWSTENFMRIPEEVKQFPSPIECAAFDDSDENRFFLYGQGFCIFVDLLLDVPEKPRIVNAIESHRKEPSIEELQNRIITQLVKGDNSSKKNLKKKIKKAQKRLEHGERHNKNFTIFTQYRSIVNLSIISGKGRPSELVVVENPWVRILEFMPTKLEVKKFGT